MQDIAQSIISLVILIFSTALHEVAHGLVALYFGDKTALRAGRLSLNPISHIDMFGSILLPFLLFTLGSPFVFGWAKPVPVNVANLRTKSAHAWVALAGPVTNALLAGMAGTAVRLWGGAMVPAFQQFLLLVVIINTVLMVFNMIPIPPFDGYHVLSYILRIPNRVYDWCMRYGLIMIVVAVLVFQRFLDGVVLSLVRMFTGVV
jgi:Zn-dependent protease